jgi:hypothetical protein
LSCGGSLQARDFDTGAQVAALDLPGASLVSLAISSDGSTLYGVDAVQRRIVRVDLDSFAAGTPITGVRADFAPTLTWTEVQGVPVLVTSELELYHAGTGVRLADAASLYPSTCCKLAVAARRDGRAFYAVNSTTGNFDVLRFALAWRNGALQVRRTHLVYRRGSGGGLALDATDSSLVLATGATTLPSGVLAGAFLNDPETLALRAGFPIAEGVGVSSVAGFAGGRTWLVYGKTVVGYGDDQVAAGSTSFGDSLNAALLSADGKRLMLLQGQYVRFVDRP